MASFSERINVVIDVTTQKASAGLKDFRTQVSQAEGFVGKLKAGVGSLSSTLGGASPAALAGATAAASAAAFKMAQDFSALGVEVGKFSDATGMSTEAASRWVETANDLGISSDGLAGILGKLNKNIDPKAFAEYGITIARASDGTVDANQTFLNTIDVLGRMKDPAEQSKAAADLLGRGWQGAAELIGMSAKDIQKRLDDVDGSKVFDARKVADARAFRDSMDRLGDSLERVTLTIGQDVAPALAEAADSLARVGENIPTGLIDQMVSRGMKPLVDLGNALGGIGDAWDWAFGPDKSNDVGVVTEQLSNVPYVLDLIDKGLAQIDANKALERKAEEAQALNDQIDANLSLENSYRSMIEALGEAKAAQEDSSKSAWDQAGATLAAKDAVKNYVRQLGDIPPEKLTEILAAIDAGSYNNVAVLLARLAKDRIVNIKINWTTSSTSWANDVLNAAQVAQTIVDDTNAALISATGSGSTGGGGGGAALAQGIAADTQKAWDAVVDNMFELGDMSEADYRKYLQARLKDYAKYSDEWMAIKRKLMKLDADDADAKKKAADDAAKKAEAKKKAAEDAKKRAEEAAAKAKADADAELQRQAMRAIVNADILGASYANIYTAADPNAVVNAIQQWQRNNGPVPIQTTG